jgi:hypothetical protein
MRRTRHNGAVLLATLAVTATTVVAPASIGAPKPPAPGNGAGASGQCTGPQVDRPSSCVSQGGPGDHH